jgi:DnaJ family protein B protein 11
MFWTIFSLSLITSEGDRDFYGILGLKHDCSEREIDVSFQRLSRKWHPDKNKGNEEAAEKFTDINDAYGTLKDPQKRRIYDLYGEPGVHLYESPKNEMNGIFSIAHSDDPNSAAAKVRKKGKTVRIQFPVSLNDFANSNHYELLITRRTMCRCEQAGYFCPKCRGKPTLRENLSLSLVVEKGSDEGSIILFKNAGDTSEANAPGDLEIELVSRPHPVFTRVGSDLHMNLLVTLKEALIGFKRTVKNIDDTDLVIETTNPIGSNRTIKLVGKGLPVYLYPGDYGDIVVHANIRWPKAMTDEQRRNLADILQRAE